jgi:hypothetical protein
MNTVPVGVTDKVRFPDKYRGSREQIKKSARVTAQLYYP